MYVSDWPKRPNKVPRPNLSGDSIFSPPWSTQPGRILLCAHNPQGW